MKLHTAMTWGLAAVLALTAWPAYAQKGQGPKGRDDDNDRRPTVRVIIQKTDDNDDVRAFQGWFNLQVRDYNNAIDPETGERIGDLVQLVTDVAPGRVNVIDRANSRRTVLMTDRTRLTFEARAETAMGPTRGNPRKGTDLTSRLRPGDLIISYGYLRSNGDFTAMNVRVVGQARGWGYNDDDDWYGQHYGFRAWGEVRDVDTRRNEVRIDSNLGTVTLTFSRDAEFIYNNKTISLRNLERGDRVVFYYREQGTRTLQVYRLVALRDGERYPEGDRPCYTDPDYRDGRDRWNDDERGTTPVVEGRLNYISSGVLFNKLVLQTNDGRTITVRTSKSLDAIDRNGDRLALFNLREGDWLRVYYNDIAGTFFAERVQLR